MPRPPLAGAHGTLALGDAPCGGHHERPGGVGGRVGQHVGGVAHRYAPARRLRDVDIVEADGDLADDLELRPRGVHQLRVHPVRKQAEQAIDALDPLQEHVARRGHLVFPEVDVGNFTDHLQGLGEYLPRHEHARSGHWYSSGTWGYGEPHSIGHTVVFPSARVSHRGCGVPHESHDEAPGLRRSAHDGVVRRAPVDLRVGHH